LTIKFARHIPETNPVGAAQILCRHLAHRTSAVSSFKFAFRARGKDRHELYSKLKTGNRNWLRTPARIGTHKNLQPCRLPNLFSCQTSSSSAFADCPA